MKNFKQVKIFVLSTLLWTSGFFLYSTFTASAYSCKVCDGLESEDNSTIVSSKLVIITHPCDEYDEARIAKTGIETLLGFAQDNKYPSIILKNDVCEPYVDHKNHEYSEYLSEGGEFKFSFTSREVYLGGGYFWHCLGYTLAHVISKFLKYENDSSIFRINLVADAIYSQLGDLSGDILFKYELQAVSPVYREEYFTNLLFNKWLVEAAFNPSELRNYNIIVNVYGEPVLTINSSIENSNTIEINVIDSNRLSEPAPGESVDSH